MRTTLTRSAAVVGTGVLLLGVSGVAYAFWTTTGSGSGTAATGTTVPVTVNQRVTASNMGPGVAAQTISGDFTNTNEATVKLSSLTATATPDKVGCSAADYSITGLTVSNGTVVKGTGGAWTGQIQFVNDTTRNQDACKNAVVTIAYTAG